MNRWAIEQIPNEDDVFRNIHKSWLNRKSDKIHPNAFRQENKPAETSVMWSKYCLNPYDAIEPMQQKNKYDIYGVVSLNVGKIREIDNVDALHQPSKNFRAHSIITSSHDEEILFALRDFAKLEVPVPL